MRGILIALTALWACAAAKAGLGWTLDECKKHYGEPTSTEAHALGLKRYSFLVKDFHVVVETDKTGKVGFISYTRDSINDELAVQIMQQNAPNVVWKPYAMEEPGYKAWISTEKTSRPRYLTIFKTSSGLSSDRASVAIGTLDFHNFEKASKRQEAKDQASGL
jgi:hypothetical protein